MTDVVLGLKQNWKQFTILVIINGFVGGMVGLERTLLPEIAETEFGIAAKTSILSFIVAFGVSKAFANYYTGALAHRFGRKNLLILGWIIGIPVPLLLMFAGSWSWIVIANIFLGINQGLTWSSTVVMKIDLVGERHRGLAMGLNESAGYLAVGLVAFLTGYIASQYGLRPYPFYLGIAFVAIGLFMSIFLVKDTVHHVDLETESTNKKLLEKVFLDTSIRDSNLGSITQAGFINNLNDAVIWGVLPILLSIKGYNIDQIGKIVSVYPMVWGLGQLGTGWMADHFSKKRMLYGGMFLQGVSILLLIVANSFIEYVLLSILLGVGTALVYPTFLAAISNYIHPQQRAKGIGVFRLWRDLGYAFGAVISGIIADYFGINWAIGVIAFLTIISAIIIFIRMD